MDTEIKRKDIIYTTMVSNAKAVTNVECDVIVPDVNPDAGVIVSVNAQPKITGRELQNDRILIYGNVDYKIIYATEDNHNESIKHTAAFTDVIDLPKAVPGMKVSLDYCLKEAKCNILNGRKLSLKSAISLNVEAYEENTLSSVYDIVSDATEKKFAEFSFLSPQTDFEKLFEVNDNIEIPNDKLSASEVLDVVSTVSEKNVRVINNKVIIKGEVTTDLIYKETETEIIRNISKVTPFTEIFDVDGISEDSFSYTDISVCTTKCEGDAIAIRDFEVSTELRGRVYCYKDDIITLVDDCYSITQSSEMKRTSVPVRVPLKSFNGQVSVKGNLESGEKIDRVLNVCVSAENESVNVTDGKINLKGKVSIKSLCILDDANKTLKTLKNVADYTYTSDYNTDEKMPCCDVYCNAGGESYTLESDGSIQVRCNVNVCGLLYTQKELDVITDVVFSERKLQPDTPSITVYFTGEDDDLWSLAKKYLTSAEKIKELNNLENSNLRKGMKLFIPKYKKTV